jgi:hypothetical protein
VFEFFVETLPAAAVEGVLTVPGNAAAEENARAIASRSKGAGASSIQRGVCGFCGEMMQLPL